MKQPNTLLILVAAGFLAAAQSSPPTPSQLSPPSQALQLMSKGYFAEARHAVASLIEVAERAGSPPGYQAGLWHLLGSIENTLGRYEEAKGVVNHGLRLCHDTQSAGLPELTVALLIVLADANLHQGRLNEANGVLHRALGIASQALPPNHPLMASVQHGLGVLSWIQGKLSRAEKAFQLALTILEGGLRPDRGDVAAATIDLAGLLTMTKRQPEAIPLLEKSKAAFEELYGPAHPDTVSATFALGVALLKLAPDKAESMLRQAITNWRISQPERHPHMVKFLSALATSRWAQRDYCGAGILSEQALQMSREIFGAEHRHVIAQMYEHAQLLKATQRGKEAAALKREADRIRALRGYIEPDRHRIDILALSGRY